MDQKEKILQEVKGKIGQEQYLKLREILKVSLVDKPREQLNRIPLFLPLLATFGLVTTFYGFEKILDKTFLVNYPLEMIGVGVLILLLTGAAAKKL